MPIDFDCGTCRQRIQTPDELAGQQARCPECLNLIDVPLQSQSDTAVQAASPPPALFHEDPERRPCPHCQASIPSVAVLCRFCGLSLEPDFEQPDDPVAAELRRRLHRTMSLLARVWALLGANSLLALLFLFGSERDESKTLTALICVFLGGGWLLGAVGSLGKHMWGVYAGLAVSYLYAAAVVFSGMPACATLLLLLDGLGLVLGHMALLRNGSLATRRGLSTPREELP